MVYKPTNITGGHHLVCGDTLQNKGVVQLARPRVRFVQGTSPQGGIQLGDFRQKIPAEGRHQDLPLILCIHPLETHENPLEIHENPLESHYP